MLDIDNYSLSFNHPTLQGSDTQGNCNLSDTYIWININSEYLNKYEIFATVAHECYHAYQNNVLMGSTEEDAYIVGIWKADYNSSRIKDNSQSLYDYFWAPREQCARWFERDPYETVTALYTP